MWRRKPTTIAALKAVVEEVDASLSGDDLFIFEEYLLLLTLIFEGFTFTTMVQV